MLSNLVVVALFLAVANSAYSGPLAGGQSAAQYPAGVNPQACPNYPICENPSVAVHQVPVSPYTAQYQPQAQYQPTAQYQPVAQYTPQSAAYVQPQAAPQYHQIPQSRYTSSPLQQYNLAQTAAPVQLQQRQYNLASPVSTRAYNTVQQPQYISAHQQAQYPSNLQAALDRGDYIGDGDYHGEGLVESGAQAQGPAYNQASYQIPQRAYSNAPAAPQQYVSQGVQQPAQLPAGLAPGACPNYPFCHQ